MLKIGGLCNTVKSLINWKKRRVVSSYRRKEGPHKYQTWIEGNVYTNPLDIKHIKSSAFT